LCAHMERALVPFCPCALVPLLPTHLFWDRLIVECADWLKTDTAEKLFKLLQYTGEPEMFTVWTSLLLDRPFLIDSQAHAFGVAEYHFCACV